MKKLNATEVSAVGSAGKGRLTRVSAMAATLQPGEGLIVTRSDWKSKDAPYRVVNYLAKKTGRTFKSSRLADGTGWLIVRVS